MSTDNVQVREERLSDIDGIEAATVAAFRDAEHTAHTEQFIVRELRRSGQLAISLVAVDEGHIVGHVGVSPVSISDGTQHWYGLGPISVLPTRQRRGIGSLLMQQALSDLRGLGASGCVVLGDSDYYSRFGFEPTTSLELPGVPAEYFQVISFCGSTPTGTVSYHDAFSATA